MAVVRQLQLLLKLLRHVLFDSVARPCLLYICSLIRYLNASCKKFVLRFSALTASVRVKETNSFAVHRVKDNCSPLPIYASRFYPNPFLGSNASRSSQDLGIVSMQSYAPENISNSRLPPPEPDSNGPAELSIVIEPPSVDESESEDRIETLSPEEMIFDRPAGDVSAITDAMLSVAHPSFWPMCPEEHPRYSERPTVPEHETTYAIDPLTTSFVRSGIPTGWKSFTHPEGALYFYHDEKRLLTDANLYDPDVYLEVNEQMHKLDDFLRAHSLQLDSDVDTVFECSKGDDGQTYCCYYFASHTHRAIFWLDSFQASNLTAWSEVRGVTCPSHLGHEIEAQYWLHCKLFPNTCKMSRELVDELRDVVMHAICDTFTSATSTAPYSRSQLQDMLNLTNAFRKSANENMMGISSALSCLMHIFARQRFYNFYSQVSARLDRDRSVHGHNVLRRSALVSLLSPLFFYAPDVHLRALQKIWVDRLVHIESWTNFMGKLNTEWQEVILYATVLLTANVSFLAIQSVDTASAYPSRSPTQIASYLSITASIGCILVGLLLIRQARTKGKETAFEAVSFLKSHKHPNHGLETLAITYSLPYSLLLWGMVSFLSAFAFDIFQTTSTLVRTIMALASFAVAALIIWCITIAWESRRNETNFWLSLISRVWKSGENLEHSSEHTESKLEKKRRWKLPIRRTSMFRRRSYASSVTAV